ncbi:hypothetical protein BCR36DRAFT_120323 [Piromyces finnis]|uniref:Uncharacterized protein n=1 Tax=Piromyces finnis TaxID=1754191 RepID=A0A1Y1V2M5_9FUNG|nr:hypothetical protein BCR36DRAFT_120323 [Piromyces finnis]|eukprot:ORX45001.1 hypothetical protein BCR36DRAFT_120323 [Piromyces finnis]
MMILSHVKLESMKPVEIASTLSGKGIKGYSYSPLFAIKVSTSHNNGDDIQIKNGKYIKK